MRLPDNFFLKSSIGKVLGYFLIWKLWLYFILGLAIIYLPLGSKDRFLGGGIALYSLSPQLFAWGNFDGEHYLAIARFGYKPLEQAFFPAYPILINFFAKPFSADYYSNFISSSLIAILISMASFVVVLIFLYKLLRLDFSEKISYFTIILLLVFPTSFYFSAVYNESLFLMLVVGSFYAARLNKWWLAAILAAIASATRVFGILLFPALLIEAYQARLAVKKAIWLILSPIGLLLYMTFQYVKFGDPIAFYNLQTVVGEQHQKGIVLIPQVFYRYLKILFFTDRLNPIYQTVVLEFFTGLGFLILPIVGWFKKIRLSYLFYTFFGFIIPTVQGSFSSLPRYVIVLFPSFLILALILDKAPKLIRYTYFALSLIGLSVEAALFLRGYWVA